MYLTEINKRTGLLDVDDINDGVLSIKAFKKIIDNPKFGLECMTAIALTADYQSPIRYYSDKDRPKKAMEEVTGKRNAFEWDTEDVQVALKKYDELQYDPVLVEGQIHYQRKVTMLGHFKESEEKYGKGIKGLDGKEILYESPSSIAAKLRQINEDIKDYEKQIQGREIYGNSPVKQGYTLSRLEQKAEKKNSFYNQKR